VTIEERIAELCIEELKIALSLKSPLYEAIKRKENARQDGTAAIVDPEKCHYGGAE